MKDQIKQKAKENLDRLVQIRRHLHQHPELSFQEHETSAFVKSQLVRIGLEPETHSDTGVVAMIKGTGGDSNKVVALRADLDALPINEQNECDYKSQNKGVMHACGHDVHTTSLLGTAMILQELRSSLNGSIKLIFQPGEEKLPGGASIMIKNGVLEHPSPSGIYGQHVYPELEAGKVGFRSGKYMASCDEIYLTVKGKGGHAALPHTVIDPILIASHIVVAMQQIVSRRNKVVTPTVLSFGKITGEGATNIIPNEVRLEGTFRTYDEVWRKEAHQLIEKLAKTTAEAMGGSCDVNIEIGYPFVNNNPELTESAKLLAIDYLGADNVEDLEMRTTAEDFSYFSQAIPGTFYRLGVRNDARGITYPVHSSRFDVDEQCLETGSGLMAWIAFNALKQ